MSNNCSSFSAAAAAVGRLADLIEVFSQTGFVMQYQNCLGVIYDLTKIFAGHEISPPPYLQI